ncbi:hypothetical protein [Nitrososphaera sp.]
MADQLFIYATTAGVIIFLACLLFGTRARRPHGPQATQVRSG